MGLVIEPIKPTHLILDNIYVLIYATFGAWSPLRMSAQVSGYDLFTTLLSSIDSIPFDTSISRHALRPG
jgi:hypothetical protein